MKLRSTTPASKSRKPSRPAAKNGKRVSVQRVMIFAVALLFAGVATTSYFQMQPVSADQFDDKIRALQADMNRYQAEANRLNAESLSLANTLAQFTNQKNAIQAQIDLNQAQYDKLVAEIKDTEEEIKTNQDALGTTLADLYVDDTVTPIEMLASSENIGDYINKQEYRNAVKDELGRTIKKVKDLKVQLTEKKTAVTKVLDEQKLARDDLQKKESEQARLLADTQNDESKFRGMVAANEQAISRERALQAELAARAQNNGGYDLVSSGSLGAYASLWAPNSCSMGGPGGWYSYGGADGNGGGR